MGAIWLLAVTIALVTGDSASATATESKGQASQASRENGAGLSLTETARQAVCVKPAPRQLAWHEHEFIAFVHFGVNTFSAREWGTGKEDPASFNPTKLDTDQWCRAMQAAGMKMVILTVKHHDGFCLWQTRYTKHSVESSPWRNGKGDVLRDLSASCLKYGLKLGVYLSPADLYQIENAEGLYGNLSQYTERTIPRPVPGRPFKDRRTFRFKVDDYNEYFLNQLFELLTEYGPVHEVWFDGAHPKRKGGQTYTYQQWYSLIRALAPMAVIFGKGPDVRWCGNEGGGTRQSEWNVIPLPGPVDECKWPDMTATELATLPKLQQTLNAGGVLHYYPAETNTSIRRGWFWRDEQQHVKPTTEILDIWYRAVGGNSVFLLNIPPNREGLFPARDVKVLEEVGRITKATFATNLAQGATAHASETRGSDFTAEHALDGDTATCWMPEDGTTAARLVVTLSTPRRFNRIVLQEQIRNYSQRIARFAIDAEIEGTWRQIAKGTTVGYKKICRTATVSSNRIRVRVLEARVCPTISNFGLYFEPVPVSTPQIRRDRQGNVSLHCDPAGPVIRYTLDGSEPTSASAEYQRPIALPRGGTVKARAFQAGAAESSDIAASVFDICAAKWKVVRASSEQTPDEPKEAAIDGDPRTIWHSRWSPETAKYPHEIVIDLGESLTLRGFTYTPRSGSLNGTIKTYAIHVSPDGQDWGQPAAQGEFGNIRNNPVQQSVRFANPHTGRFIKFVATSEVNGQPWASAAEIGVVTR